MKLITNKYLLISTLSVLCILFLTAQTPYDVEQAQILPSPEEQELDRLAKELMQLDNATEKQTLIDQKNEIQAKLDELKSYESNVNQIHNQYKKIKLNLKSFKKECSFTECQNVLRYTITNNSDIKITNFSYRLTIRHKGKVIYSEDYHPHIEKSIYPGASDSINSGFDEDNEIYDMVLPKGTTTTMTLLGVQTNFQDWEYDPYEPYQRALKEIKTKLKDTEDAIKQFDKNADKRRKEINKRIAQLKH